MTNAARNHFRALDGWRAAAALAIALHRLGVEGYLTRLPVIANSYLFVDFFFVLSGFVITHAYWQKVRDVPSFINFTIRRFGRLWPLHVSLLAAFVAIEWARLRFLSPDGSAAGLTAPDQLLSIGAHGLLVQALGFTPEFAARWNVPSWSISVEFWTYILFGLMCVTARRSFLAISCILIAGSLLLIGAMSPQNMNTAFDYGLARCFTGFFMGHICYRIWAERHETLEAMIRRAGATRTEMMVVLLALAFVSVAGTSPLSLLAPLFFAPLVLVFAFEQGALSRRLQHAVSVELGALSYSIYMVALLVVTVILQTAKQAEGRLGISLIEQSTVEGKSTSRLELGSALANDAFALVYLGVIVIVSKMTYTVIEAPGRRFFNALAYRVSPNVRAALPAAE